MIRFALLSSFVLAGCGSNPDLDNPFEADPSASDAFEADGSASLPVGQAAPPSALSWNFPGYFIKASPFTLTVAGGPAAGTAAFVISTAPGGPPACPGALAPDCLGIPAPFTVFTTRPFSAGSASFPVNIPAASPVTAVWLQIAGVQGANHWLSPAVRAQVLDAAGDFDLDGISNIEEARTTLTNPLAADTDGDGLGDGDELGLGTDPLDTDSDDDGLTDGDEVAVHGTNPLDVDTDGGSVGDGDEVALGQDPLDPADDVPPPPPTFQGDILPTISRVRCAGCHTGGGASGGFNQEVYANWLAPSTEAPGLRRVQPGNLAASYVWHKVRGTQATVGGSGSRMPLAAPALNPTEIALIEAWILAGAPEN